MTEKRVMLDGLGVSKGEAKGKARVILNQRNLNQFRDGEILITQMTDPNYVDVMKRASAVITDIGGYTCHAAIVSRELGIPCIVATKQATTLINTGDEVTVTVEGLKAASVEFSESEVS